MLHDRAKIYVEGGVGGDGCVSFRREAHVPKGGPDGGDGGRGGDVTLVCDPSQRDLAALRHAQHYRAGQGSPGEGSRRHGARGADIEVPVAPGTQVEGLDGARYDLVEQGRRLVIAGGGAGGHGNKRFASSTRQTPRFAERGLPGESGWVELRLKLLADAGLVGLPNAGKSSLLSRLTRATPKVADYPFTTIEPVLGTLELDDRQLVLADIPGLIEGASEGAGLGHEFLAHVERCRMLVHVLDVAPPEGDPRTAYETVRAELAAHDPRLPGLTELVALNKADLLPSDEAEAEAQRWRAELGGRVAGVLVVSAATGAGLDELRAAIVAAWDEASLPLEARPDPNLPQLLAEHRVYRPAGEGGYEVVKVENGAYEVRGRGVELLLARHDLSNDEARAYLEQRLREIGVISALQKAGFEPGDQLRIGDTVLALHPRST